MQPDELHKIAEGREAAMKAAANRGVRVPAVHGLTTVMDRPGMIMERIDGPDLLTMLGRRPWMVLWVGRVTGEIHAQLNAVTASSSMPPLRATLKTRIESSGPLPNHLARFAIETLDGLPDGNSLCHGDFHIGNIMMSRKTPVVIDWTNATRGDPAADVARTLMLSRIAEAPPWSPLLVRYLRTLGSKIVIFGYLRAYRRRRPLDMALVEQWEAAHAAARLASEPIEGEEPALVKLLEERRANATGT